MPLLWWENIMTDLVKEFYEEKERGKKMNAGANSTQKTLYRLHTATTGCFTFFTGSIIPPKKSKNWIFREGLTCLM